MLSLRQDDDSVFAFCHNSNLQREAACIESVSPQNFVLCNVNTFERLYFALHHYFHLSENVRALFSEWSTADSRMSTIASSLPGMRLLRQAPFETLISYICSSNNNIPRISQVLLLTVEFIRSI